MRSKSIFCFAFLVLLLHSGVAIAQSTEDWASVETEIVRLYKERRYTDALPLALKLAAARDSDPNAKETAKADAARLLGLIQLSIGNLEEATKNLERSLAIYESVRQPGEDDRLAIADLSDALGFAQYKSGNTDKAIGFFEKAIAAKSLISGADSLGVAETLWNLAAIEYRRKNYKKAFEHYNRVYLIRAARLGLMAGSTVDAEIRSSCTASKADKEFKPIARTTEPQPADKSALKKPDLIRGGVINGKAIVLAQPPYPFEARVRGITGKAEVDVVIDEKGAVIFACAVKGNPVFHSTVESAAYASQFTPTTLYGNPVKVFGTIVYNFSR